MQKKKVRWAIRVCLSLSLCFLLLAAFTKSKGSSVPTIRQQTNPSTEILLDIGHGGIDGGTSYGSILEKDINLAVGLKLYRVLSERGIQVSMNRMSDYALSDDNHWLRGGRHKRDLAQRVEIANRLKPKALISLHVNWSSNPSRSGPIVIYQKKKPSSKLLAEQLQTALNELYGSKATPEVGKTYYLLRNSKVPSVIVEMGFMSNSRDRGLLQDKQFQLKLANVLADSLEEALKKHPNYQPKQSGSP